MAEVVLLAGAPLIYTGLIVKGKSIFKSTMGSEEVETKLLQKLIDVIINLFPVIVSTCSAGYKVYKKLPMPYVQLIIGSIICFFGGIYPTVFAALQVSYHNHNTLFIFYLCVYKRYMGTHAHMFELTCIRIYSISHHTGSRTWRADNGAKVIIISY